LQVDLETFNDNDPDNVRFTLSTKIAGIKCCGKTRYKFNSANYLQDSISLVNNKTLQISEHKVFRVLQVIQESARCCDQQVHSFSQFLDFRLPVSPAHYDTERVTVVFQQVTCHTVYLRVGGFIVLVLVYSRSIHIAINYDLYVKRSRKLQVMRGIP
jgi:hypothetical protein